MSSIGQHYSSGEMYGRVYEVQIASAALAQPDDKELLKKAYRYGNISGNNPLHTQFTVEQQSVGFAKCHVTLANLGENVRNNIRPMDAIRLYAGYPESYGLVYYGYIATHETKQSGPDVYTRITCTGLPPEITATNYSRSFTGATKRSDILRDVQKKCKLRISSSGRSSVLQVARGVYSGLPEVVYPNGIALNGTPENVLRRLFPPPFIVEVENGVIVLRDITQPYKRVVVVLNTKTGLIGTPGTTENGSYTVYKFISLMNVRLRVGAFVELTTSNAAQPIYCCVQSARFTGDSRSGPWFVECTATPCDPTSADASFSSASPAFMDSFAAGTDGEDEGLEE